MKNWRDVLVGPATSLREALGTIDRGGCQMALVVDAEGRLLGTLSDGDVRRSLLRGSALEDRVELCMHVNPTCASVDERDAEILSRMRRLGLHQIPVIDAGRRVQGLRLVDDFLVAPVRPNWVVIMAGGRGTRLQDLTRETPKPMLKVGSRPLLETIVRGYADQGFRNFFLAVNFKAEVIERHFGDGSWLDVQIQYLREKQRMGTAGALGLLPRVPEDPILVTNADVLTKEDYGALLDHHVESGALATMGVREFEMQVPFGVVRATEGRIEGIDEKPVQRFVVAAGVYVLSPRTLSYVPPGAFFDMPGLFQAIVQDGQLARSCRIDGYWIDIGRPADYEQANADFPEEFE